jgi:imidazolonepropionase-like amidohydrolase
MLLLLSLISATAQDVEPDVIVPLLPPPPAGVALILRNARLVDADGARTADVAISDGRITAIGPSLDLLGLQELDLAGSTVTPGLIDSHVHTTFATGSGLFEWSDAYEDTLIQHSLRAYVAAGVTTVLDCASVDADLARVLGHLQTGIGPRVLHLGEPPAQAGTYGPTVLPDLRVQSSPDELSDHLRHLKQTGSVGVKVLFEDGVMRPVWALPGGEWLDALVAAAVAQELPTYVHAMSPEETAAALSIQPHALVHGLLAPDAEVAAAVAAQDPYVIATMHISASSLYPARPEWQTDPLRELLVHPTIRSHQDDPKVREKMALAVGDIATPRLPAFLVKRLGASTKFAQGMLDDRMEATAQLHDAGVRLVVGSDAPGWPVLIDNLPAWSTIRELELLHEAGLTPAEVLAAATSVPAEMLGLADELGAIRVGLAADLVVMTGDPLADIGAWRTVTQVIQGGEVHTPEEWLSE